MEVPCPRPAAGVGLISLPISFSVQLMRALISPCASSIPLSRSSPTKGVLNTTQVAQIHDVICTSRPTVLICASPLWITHAFTFVLMY